jgi:hypothetical protein
MARVFFPTVSLNRFGVRETGQRATLGLIAPRFDSEPTPRAANVPTAQILGRISVRGLGAVQMLPPQSNLIIVRELPYGWFGPVGAPGPSSGGAPVTLPPLVPISAGPISASGGGGAVPAPAVPTSVPASPPPVSSQVLPTPTVTTPPPAAAAPVIVSSGGGVATPATAPVVAAAVTYTTDASGNIINAQTGALFLTAAQAASMGVTAASLNAGATSVVAATAAPATPGLTDQVTAWLGGSTSILSYSVPNALLAAAVVLGFAWLSSGSKKR